MRPLFEEVASLDRRCYEQFGLSEDLLMEHAADGMADFIRARFAPGASVAVVCGPGNNGADGIALGRLLHGDYRITLVAASTPSSAMCRLQHQRAEALDIPSNALPEACDVVVDALFGTGISRAFDDATRNLLRRMNALKAFKIACDVPTGLHPGGTLDPDAFVADVTLTMGALKRTLYSDAAKDAVGTIHVLDLGVARSRYETPSDWQLLEPGDLTPPFRLGANTHKGSFGHLGVICGEKCGAAVIAGSAALRYGVGLVTLISNEQVQIPHELMQSHLLPATATAIAAGMGLGQEFSEEELHVLFDHGLSLLIDADLFHHPMLLELLKRPNVLLTPHPKEFTALLSACGIADIDVATLQNDRFGYVEAFAEAYPGTVLLLKGANPIIAAGGTFYVNPQGTSVLAKGGSGDVLAGIIGALLAQGYTPAQAAIQGSLAHTAAAAAFTGNNYALTPFDLIAALASL